MSNNPNESGVNVPGLVAHGAADAATTAASPRRVLVVLVDRANYGRLKPVMRAIDSHAALQLQVVCAGSMVLRRFDRPVELIRSEGFPVAGEVYLEIEGSTPSTMAKSVGLATIEFSNEFRRLGPDMVLLIGDRYEALGAAIAAVYMNLPLVHVQGGEVSGSIDESARHAISKLAHFHFPSTQRAADYLLRMGERAETILGVGCPSGDMALRTPRELPEALRQHINARGSGAPLEAGAEFLLALFHPNTAEYGNGREQMTELLTALHDVQRPTLLLWPNIDAGSDQVSKAIRVFRDQHREVPIHSLTNLEPEQYLQVLASCACAVGNSSSFVRDASFLGTPVVLVGKRQVGRETAPHLLRVEVERVAIGTAIQAQLAHGPYERSTLYGDGHAAERLAAALAQLEPYAQKRLSYLDEPDESSRAASKAKVSAAAAVNAW